MDRSRDRENNQVSKEDVNNDAETCETFRVDGSHSLLEPLSGLIVWGTANRRHEGRQRFTRQFAVMGSIFSYGSAGSNQSVTGCLQKGDEPGGFTITGEDGKVWELQSKKVQLASHVGHTVTVTGSAGNRSTAEEQTTEGSEKKEHGQKEHGDLRVGSLKMISDTCSK
jgi:hypothetical protein